MFSRKNIFSQQNPIKRRRSKSTEGTSNFHSESKCRPLKYTQRRARPCRQPSNTLPAISIPLPFSPSLPPTSIPNPMAVASPEEGTSPSQCLLPLPSLPPSKSASKPPSLLPTNSAIVTSLSLYVLFICLVSRRCLNSTFNYYTSYSCSV